MMSRFTHRLMHAVATLLLGVTAGSLGAQGVRVQIIDDRTREPIGGAIVSLIDGTGSPVVEGLTAASGHRLLNPPSAGDYRILVRRVGYVPVSSPVIAIPAGQTIPYVLAVTGQRVVLPSVVSRARRACRSQVDEVARTSVLWEEIRKALTASELTRSEGYSAIQRRVLEREVDDEERITRETWSPWHTTRDAPFVAVDPAELSRHGYLLRDDGKPVDLRSRDILRAELVYHGPDAAVLLSPEFERDHCFQLVAGNEANDDAIGLAFTPIEGREVPDIAGTLWVDRETAELRFVQFEYVNTGLPAQIRGGGGRIAFQRLPTGEWIVSDWTLRIPRVLLGRRPRDARLLGFNVVGGQAGPARLGSIAGTVYDSLAGAALTGARISLADSSRFATTGVDGRFTLDSLVPGEHGLLFAHPLLDSLGIGAVPLGIQVAPDDTATLDLAIPSHRRFRSACGADRPVGPDSGMVAGTVYDGDGGVTANATVILSWTPPDSTAPAHASFARSDARGAFAVCGLPVGAPIDARAETADRASPQTRLLIGPRAIARLDFVLEPRAAPALRRAEPPRRR